MPASQVDLRGQVTVGGCDASPCGPGNVKLQQLQLRCADQWFGAVVSTDAPHLVQTAGAVGAAWAELPAAEALDRIELLILRADQPVRLRLGAAPAELTGSGGGFPTGFSGGEMLELELDGDAVSVEFESGDQSAAQVAARINAASVLAGLDWLPAAVVGGQVRLRGQATGAEGALAVAGTAAEALGFGSDNDEAAGAGADVDVYGQFVCEFGRGQPGSVARVQISGSARVEVFAAGTPA